MSRNGHHPAFPDLGSCCVCEVRGPQVRNVVMLNKRHPDPIPRFGCWGCFQCGLPCEGAVAVLCDDCVRHQRTVRFACSGPAGLDRRIPIERLTEPFLHDESKHPGEKV